MVHAEVVPLVHLDRERTFDYLIPPRLLPDLTVGSLVTVPLKTRLVAGAVVALRRTSRGQHLKPIHRLVHPSYVSKETFTTARFLADQYLAQLGECLNAILPS